MSLIDINTLFFKYKETNPFSVQINHLLIQKEQHVFLEGPSGCGKTTLLNLMTGLCAPQSGSIHILNTDITSLPAIKTDQFRADHFGIIFQQFRPLSFVSYYESFFI